MAVELGLVRLDEAFICVQVHIRTLTSAFFGGNVLIALGASNF